MKTDLKQVGAWLLKNKLMRKPFQEFSEDQILDLCEQIKDATQVDDYAPPYINEKGELIIPHNAHPKHRYWTPRGQSLRETLKEMEVSNEFFERYCPAQDHDGLPRNRPAKGEKD